MTYDERKLTPANVIVRTKPLSTDRSVADLARPVVGVLEWFRVGDEEHVERALTTMRQLGVQELRTGISWADWHTPEGAKWYEWLLPRITKEVNILPCVLYTPPSLGIQPKQSAPPRNPKDYADFIDVLITRHGDSFEYIELWNEPNNCSEWDYTLDPNWYIFGQMVGGAAYWAQKRGKKTVLAGMSPIDPNWLRMIIERDILKYIDVVGVHAFPDINDLNWTGWEANIAMVREVLEASGYDRDIWITETGFSTWRHDEYAQVQRFLEALEAPVGRVYWYSMFDLHPSLPTIDGFHTDDREYSFGLRHHDGTEKLLSRVWHKGGIEAVKKVSHLRSCRLNNQRGILITGGAGFIGANFANRLLEMKHDVILFDNLSRPGVEQNVEWLRHTHGNRVHVEVADLRDRHAVKHAVKNADEVFHFAAQVAVTSSLDTPSLDFEVNAQGTLNLLEALRALPNPPPLVYTSTNKVYGCLDDVALQVKQQRYQPADTATQLFGINENRPLDFHSPYGCSKGAAEQYVLDYARSFGMRTAVLRMSCIYGPHQMGTTHQGWVSHFVSQVINGQPIVLYGDGLQVRDLLFIDDLVEAFLLMRRHIDSITGQVFNLGGGPGNTISLLELVDLLGVIHSKQPKIVFNTWRTGDQKYYVSDTAKFSRTTGWRAMIGVREGVERLYDWLSDKKQASKPLAKVVNQ